MTTELVLFCFALFRFLQVWYATVSPRIPGLDWIVTVSLMVQFGNVSVTGRDVERG